MGLTERPSIAIWGYTVANTPANFYMGHFEIDVSSLEC